MINDMQEARFRDILDRLSSLVTDLLFLKVTHMKDCECGICRLWGDMARVLSAS